MSALIAMFERLRRERRKRRFIRRFLREIRDHHRFLQASLARIDHARIDHAGEADATGHP